MRFSYDNVGQGAHSLARAFAMPTAQKAENDELKSLANVDHLRAVMGKADAEAALKRDELSARSNGAQFLADQGGVTVPQAQQFLDYQKNGNWGMQPTNYVEPNSPEMPITEIPAAIAPLMEKLQQAARTYSATRTASSANPEQIAKARGEYRGQDVTDEVLGNVRSGNVDLASTLNQGGKLGTQIKRFDNVGNTGAVYSPATGDVNVGKNALVDAFIKKGAGTKAPAGYAWGPADDNGQASLVPIPGGPRDPATKVAKITDTERMASGFASRMEAAEKIMGDNPGGQNPGLIESAAGVVPLAGNMLANSARSGDRQKYRQAQEDWVRSKLRKESGAVIGKDEMNDEIRTYFPQIGDGDEVIAQKAQARQVAMSAMREAAGPAYGAAPVAPINPGAKTVRYDAKGNRI